MEAVVGGAFAWVAVALMLAVHRRFFRVDAAPDPAHEGRCAQGFLLAALRAAPGRGAALAAALEARLGGRREVGVGAGPRPWPLYAHRVRIERRAGDVVCVRVVGAALRRGERTCADVVDVVLDAAAAVAHDAAVEEVWLHGAAHEAQGGSRVDRSRVAWIGRIDARGRLVLRTLIGKPRWLAAAEAPPALAA
jgi:hypothetical protein